VDATDCPSESMQEARDPMTRLAHMVEGLVARDMLMHMDKQMLARHGIGIEDNNAYVPCSSTQSITAFKDDLNTSRVYRRLGTRPSLWSISTSQQGSMALSAFSTLTIDNVSNLSVLRLPVWSTDLFNASGYNFQRRNPSPRDSPVAVPNDSSLDSIARNDPTRGISPELKQDEDAIDHAKVTEHASKTARPMSSKPSMGSGLWHHWPKNLDCINSERIDKIIEKSAAPETSSETEQRQTPSPNPHLPQSPMSVFSSSSSSEEERSSVNPHLMKKQRAPDLEARLAKLRRHDARRRHKFERKSERRCARLDLSQI
jgi:hypothetical protein